MALHTINFMTDVNPQSLAALQNIAMSALHEGATEITVYFSCIGGSTDLGFTAYHFLKSLPVPLTMHCIGNVESMGIIVFLAGETRIATPHSKFKIHPLHWSFPASTIDHDRLNEFSQSIDFDADRYASIFEERTKGAKNPINIRDVLAGKAHILGAAAAVDSGLATTTAEAVIPATVKRWWV